MKNIILITICLLFVSLAFSQELTPASVPNAVRTNFTKQFPSATMIKYEREQGIYKVSFLNQAKSCVVEYNTSGNLLETEIEVAPTALPKVVSSSASKNFPGYTIVTAVRREAPDKGVCFEMDLKKNDAGYTVRFSDKGEILQKIARKVQIKVTTKSAK
jgi:hypothetical protein